MLLSTEIVRYNRGFVRYNQEELLFNWVEPNTIVY
jgi:hypothetical protein